MFIEFFDCKFAVSEFAGRSEDGEDFFQFLLTDLHGFDGIRKIHFYIFEIGTSNLIIFLF